jgi:cytochrome c-type biogenesis protein CcmE
MKKNKNIIIAVLITIVVAGLGGFYGGMKYSQLSSARTPGDFRVSGGVNFQQISGQRTGLRDRAGGGFVTGEIISKDESSIVVKSRDGNSKVILVTSSTKTMKNTEGVPDDLVSGKQVVVNGTANSDGSITAETVQVMPDAGIFSQPQKQ